MKQGRVFKVDLTRIDGDGDFSCPRCENAISPNDESEETYSIVEPKASKDGLTKVIIRCNRCASRIHLTGFPLLHELETKKEETPLQFPRLQLPLPLNLGKLR